MTENTSPIKILNFHSIFCENALCLSSRSHWKIEQDFNPQKGDVYVVFGAHEQINVLLNARDPSGGPVHYVIMNSEQSHSPYLKNKYYLELMKKNVVINFTRQNFLEKFDIKTLGYFDFEFLDYNLKTERIYDITFIGSYSNQRQQCIQTLKEAYPEKTFYIDLEWKNSDANSITQVLSQSKYVLNIPFYEDSALETHRINKALSCGCEVVSLNKDTLYFEDEKKRAIYEKHIYFTNNLVEFFGVEHEPRGDYPNIMYELNVLHLADLIWIVNQVMIRNKGHPLLF